MLIGELARRTGTSERLLRYYERAGLLRPERQPNGYRTYDETAHAAVLRIRSLLAAGLPTRVIRQVLPCTDAEAAVLPCPGVLDALRAQLRALDQRSAEIAAARDVLRQTITTAETTAETATAATPDATAATPDADTATPDAATALHAATAATGTAAITPHARTAPAPP